MIYVNIDLLVTDLDKTEPRQVPATVRVWVIRNQIMCLVNQIP